jgi:hypothetical protein
MTSLEVLFAIVKQAINSGDRVKAMKTARHAAPYTGRRAEQIVDEMAACKSVVQMCVDVQERIRRAVPL